jgi:nitrogen regulatory protein PII
MYDQAFQEKIVDLLTRQNCRGFSCWTQVQGRGAKTGEPHMGTHAWPSMCSAIMTVVPDEKVDGLLEKLHALDMETEMLGLRAFVWTIEKTI